MFFALAHCNDAKVRLDNLSLEVARAAVFNWNKYPDVRKCFIGHMSDANKSYNRADMVLDSARYRRK